MGRASRKISHYEIQVLQSGEKYDMVNCGKADGHSKYIKVNELSEHIKDDLLLEFITIRCNLTGMIEVPCDERLRCGSSLVQKTEMFTNVPCPCRDCKADGVKEWGKVTLSTALHVIQNENDAEMSKVRLFYDSDECSTVELCGLKSHSRDEAGDWCALVCVTHDLDLLKRLKIMLDRHWKLGHSLKEKYLEKKSKLVIVVSHPHGGPKRVSIGKGKVKDLAREVRDDQNWCYYSYDAATCDGSSGGPVYILGQWNDGFGYWFGHAHNHCGIDSNQCSSSTVGVESTHGQLTHPFSSINIDDEENSADVADTLIYDEPNPSQTENVVLGSTSEKPRQPHTAEIHNVMPDEPYPTHTSHINRHSREDKPLFTADICQNFTSEHHLYPQNSSSENPLQPHNSSSVNHLQPQNKSSEYNLQPQNSSSEHHLQPHNNSSEYNLQPQNSSFEHHLQPQNSSSEYNLQPQNSSSEYNLQSHNSSSEHHLQPHNNSTEHHLQPQNSSFEHHLQPHNNSSEHHLQPHNNSSEHHLQPHNNSSEHHLQPHNNSTEHHLQPQNSSSEYNLQPHSSSSEQYLPSRISSSEVYVFTPNQLLALFKNVGVKTEKLSDLELLFNVKLT